MDIGCITFAPCSDDFRDTLRTPSYTVTPPRRQRTHWDGCHEVHAECAAEFRATFGTEDEQFYGGTSHYAAVQDEA